MRFWGSGINFNRPRRAIIGRVYERFKPIFEWSQEEDDHHSLHIYLPGFHKELLKVTYENPNILRVCGERFVAGNKWDSFRQEFTIPKTCKKSGIRAKLDGGILIITMPKKITDASTTTRSSTIAATSEPGAPMKIAKQATDSAKPSSSSLNGTIPQQKPNDQQKALDRNKEKEPLIEKIRKTKMSYSNIKDTTEGHMLMVKRLAMKGMKEGRMAVVNMVAVLVVVLVAAALGVYVSYFIGASSEGNQLSNISSRNL